MLASELHNTHANKLEWIIIWLIMIEVRCTIVIKVYHDKCLSGQYD